MKAKKRKLKIRLYKCKHKECSGLAVKGQQCGSYCAIYNGYGGAGGR